MNTRLPISGNLMNMDFAELLQQLNRHSFFGMVKLKSTPGEKTIFCQDRKILFVQSSCPEDRLGAYLLRQGIINAETLAQCSQYKEERKIRLGRALQELHIIPPETLWEHVTAHMRAIVFSLFAQSKGHFSVSAQSSPPEENIRLNDDMIAVLIEGIRQLDDADFFRARLLHLSEFVPVSDDRETLSMLKAHERHILELTRQTHGIQEIMKHSELLPDSTWKCLYLLLRLGLIGNTAKIAQDQLGQMENRRQISFVSYEEALQHFNRKYSYIYKIMAKEIGPVAFSILQEAIGSVLEHIPAYLQNIQITSSGALQVDLLMKTLWYYPFADHIADVLHGLEEIMHAEIFAIRRHLGKEFEQSVWQWIRDEGSSC